MSDTQVPESRGYIHERCSEGTEISGQSFEVASNPLSDMTRTWCNKCNAFFPIAEYRWADTGETIPDYYARHGARATRIERFLCSKLFLAITLIAGLLAGIAAAVAMFRGRGLGVMLFMCFGLGVVGVIVFGSLNAFGLGPLILKRVCGVKDSRVLT